MIKSSYNYYYLVAGLPDIHFGRNPGNLKITELINQIKSEIQPDDLSYIKILFYPYDNANLINYCLKQNKPWNPYGNYGGDLFKYLLLQGDSELPEYMHQFYHDFNVGVYANSEVLPENLLTALFYDYLLANSEGFIREWFAFDRDLRNILTALSARYHDQSPEKALIGDNELIIKLKQSHNYDFGLSPEFPFIEQLIRLHEQQDFSELERQIDFIRWNKIEELTAFSYFNLEVILGYLLKLKITRRWSMLDAQNGRKLLDSKIDKLRKSIKFTDEFAL